MTEIFTRLKLGNWRQFAEIDIEFHPRLTVLTGENGSGKSSLLSILALFVRTHGMPAKFISTPDRKEAGGVVYSSDVHSPNLKPPPPGEAVTNIVGELTLDSGQKSTLLINNEDVSTTYQLRLSPKLIMLGIYMPSHRPMGTHHSVASIPIKPPSHEDILREYESRLETARYGMTNQPNQTPHLSMKQTLVSLAYLGPGNVHVEKNSDAERLFSGFKNLLKKMLPEDIGFKDFHVVSNEIALETESGRFSFDGMSGGLEALVGIAWEIYLAANIAADDTESFVVILDEPENHLHPALQRKLIPTLMRAFPTAQFIVATHSPFVVTAEPESSVYMLSRNVDHKIQSVRIEDLNRAGTANEALREALGLKETMPIWAGERLRSALEEFKHGELTDEKLELLALKLESIGLGDFIPTTVAKLVDEMEVD